jgi:hypothetical protein
MDYEEQTVAIATDLYDMVQHGLQFKDQKMPVSTLFWNVWQEIKYFPDFHSSGLRIKVNERIIQCIANELFQKTFPCWANIIAYFVICIECAHVNKSETCDGDLISEVFGKCLHNGIGRWVNAQKGGWDKGFNELLANAFLKEHNILMALVKLTAIAHQVFPTIPQDWYSDDSDDE